MQGKFIGMLIGLVLSSLLTPLLFAIPGVTEFLLDWAPLVGVLMAGVWFLGGRLIGIGWGNLLISFVVLVIGSVLVALAFHNVEMTAGLKFLKTVLNMMVVGLSAYEAIKDL